MRSLGTRETLGRPGASWYFSFIACSLDFLLRDVTKQQFSLLGGCFLFGMSRWVKAWGFAHLHSCALFWWVYMSCWGEQSSPHAAQPQLWMHQEGFSPWAETPTLPVSLPAMYLCLLMDNNPWRGIITNNNLTSLRKQWATLSLKESQPRGQRWSRALRDRAYISHACFVSELTQGTSRRSCALRGISDC